MNHFSYDPCDEEADCFCKLFGMVEDLYRQSNTITIPPNGVNAFVSIQPSELTGASELARFKTLVRNVRDQLRAFIVNSVDALERELFEFFLVILFLSDDASFDVVDENSCLFWLKDQFMQCATQLVPEQTLSFEVE